MAIDLLWVLSSLLKCAMAASFFVYFWDERSYLHNSATMEQLFWSCWCFVAAVCFSIDYEHYSVKPCCPIRGPFGFVRVPNAIEAEARMRMQNATYWFVVLVGVLVIVPKIRSLRTNKRRGSTCPTSCVAHGCQRSTRPRSLRGCAAPGTALTPKMTGSCRVANPADGCVAVQAATPRDVAFNDQSHPTS